ncbi:neprilysin-1 [Ixodes scapularis]|uniref:neprilysin-1 n=1 Tax=Ixodes scapularis TaxID=6945 RepID=UPI001A9E115A|nr:neprilysin-1 [Ixodes scapularis]
MESELERIYTTKPTRTSNVLATAVDMVRCDTAARFNYSNFLDGDPMFPVPDQTLLTECRYIHQENLLCTCYSQDREEIGWLSETGRTNYDKVRACVRSLYNVSDQAFKVHINTTRTLPNNMADLLALMPAFRFFRLKAAEDAHPKPRFKLPSFPELSQDRIFFYSFGESFCEILPADALRRTAYFSSVPPNKIRLNTMLRNEDLFGKVFDCKPGSPMRPTKKQRCKIWPLWTGELIEPVDVYSAKAREY